VFVLIIYTYYIIFIGEAAHPVDVAFGKLLTVCVSLNEPNEVAGDEQQEHEDTEDGDEVLVRLEVVDEHFVVKPFEAQYRISRPARKTGRDKPPAARYVCRTSRLSALL
jgi:hypothetical protein